MDASVRKNEFHIVGGNEAGTVLRIPPGKVTIGSGDEANVQLQYGGVSRLHASLTPMSQRMILRDNGSKYGTWVNGEQITTPTEIVDGDLLQFGSVRVRFRQRLVTVQKRTRDNRRIKDVKEPKEKVGVAILFAAGINILGLAGNAATSFLTELTPTWSWFITPVVGLVVAVITEVIGHYRKSPEPAPRPRPGGPPPPPPRRGAPLVATVLATVILLGGGTWLITAGVSYAVGFFSGNEAGVQRLEMQTTREVQGVSVTVLGVTSTTNFTRVEILMRNGTDATISVPLFQNCSLTSDDGTTLDADTFRSSWGTDIAAGSQRKGIINFPGQVAKEGGSYALHFSTIFAQGFNAPRSISVPNIRLTAIQAEARR